MAESVPRLAVVIQGPKAGAMSIFTHIGSSTAWIQFACAALSQTRVMDSDSRRAAAAREAALTADLLLQEYHNRIEDK